jgi:predicted Zn-dependent protease
MGFFRVLTSLLLLTGCFSKKEVTQTANTSPLNPNAPTMWENSNFPITLKVNTTFSASERTGVTNMSSAWKTALSNKATFFTTTTTTTVSANNIADLNSLWDNEMGVYRSTTWHADLPSTALAVTQIFGVRENRGSSSERIRIVHADILMNYRDFAFVNRLTAPAATPGYDFQTVILHEMGHFLGLYHQTDSLINSVMYPSIGTSDVERVPYADDIDSMNERYWPTALSAQALTGYQPDEEPQDYDPIDPTAPVNEINQDSEGVIKITLELHADGKCRHKINGVEQSSHPINLK